jgi:hypothetical protein
LFHQAGLQIDQFQSISPSSEWEPTVPLDQRIAWKGVFPGRSEWELTVEAGPYRGLPVYFHSIPPLEIPPDASSWGTANRVSPATSWILELTLYLVGGYFAIRNLRRERVDWNGTLFMVASSTLAWLVGMEFGTHHVANLSAEIDRLSQILGMATISGVKLGIAYLAIEPYVRRHWPWQLVGWARLIHGRWRDPKVGSEILSGVFSGISFRVRLYAIAGTSRLAGISQEPALWHGIHWGTNFRRTLFIGSRPNAHDNGVLCIVSTFSPAAQTFGLDLWQRSV